MTTVFAFSPAFGDDAGFAVVTGRFVCLLSADASLRFARELFQRLDGGTADRQDALTALHSAGVERFALIEMLDGPATSVGIAVRGRVSVGIEGRAVARSSDPLDAISFTTEARDVTGLWVSLDVTTPEGDLLSIGRGIVRAGALAMESEVEAPLPVTPAPSAERAEPAHPIDSTEPTERIALPELVAQPEPDGLDDADDDTSILRVELGGDDEHWVLRLPDGNELDAEGTIIIGRTSWEPEEGDEPVRRVSVPSPMRQISGSHLELALVDGELVARDLDSTNGTIILTPERPPRLLHGGSTMSLQTGDVLDLGESFRIVVSSRH